MYIAIAANEKCSDYQFAYHTDYDLCALLVVCVVKRFLLQFTMLHGSAAAPAGNAHRMRKPLSEARDRTGVCI